MVETFLEYLYTDSQYCLSTKDGDFLMKLLVLSDEYLVEPLKKYCAHLVVTMNYLDLKNAIEILQVALNIKCSILVNGVMEYIVHNILYFLEIKAFNNLSDEFLSEISTHYVGYMKLDRRFLTYNVETDCSRKIVDIHSKYPVNFDISEKKKTISIHKIARRRHKRNSVNERNLQKSSDDEKDEGKEDSETVNTQNTDVENDRSNTQERLSAIFSATKKMDTTDDEPVFTNLRKLSLSNSFDNFPLLNSPPGESIHNRMSNSSVGKSVKKHKMVRLSQKERIRLSSENKEIAETIIGSYHFQYSNINFRYKLSNGMEWNSINSSVKFTIYYNRFS